MLSSIALALSVYHFQMPSKEKTYGKGPRNASRIGRQYKNKLWRRKKLTQIAVSSDHELDHEARPDDNSHN